MWKFNLLEIIDRETINRVKMMMLIDELEWYGRDPISNYPYLYLLKRIIEEVKKKDWLSRDHQLSKTFSYLKEGVIDRSNLDEERDKKIYESGVYGYFVESLDFRKMFEGFIQGVKNFEREW